jgi:hypothetical protein
MNSWDGPRILRKSGGGVDYSFPISICQSVSSFYFIHSICRNEGRLGATPALRASLSLSLDAHSWNFDRESCGPALVFSTGS